MTDAEQRFVIEGFLPFPALPERVHSQSPKQKWDIFVLCNTGHSFQIFFWILLTSVSVLKKHQSVMNKWTHRHNKQFLMDEASIVTLLWNITESDNTENMVCSQCEPILDWHEQIQCFWLVFLLLILTGNSVSAWGSRQEPDRHAVQACMPLLTVKS